MQRTATEVHSEALRRAYALVEAAQDRDVAGEIDALEVDADERAWDDVRCLLHFARSLAAREVGADDSAPLRAMRVSAEVLGDPALLALALAVGELRRCEARQPSEPDQFGATPLVRAVVLLDAAAGLAVHRAAAHIEVGITFHTLGLWELATEQYDLAETALAASAESAWLEVARRQRRAIAVNRIDAVLDWACALAEVDEWDAAAPLARAAQWDAVNSIDHEWPATWVAQVHAAADLLAALAGEPSRADRTSAGTGGGDLRDATSLVLSTVAVAVRAARAGQWDHAAALAAGCVNRIGPIAPPHVRLLAMNLAAHGPGQSEAALAYARELATLRWNNRFDRLASARVAVQAERRRFEHEQLRRQALVDDLTGLANRRAYNAYVDGLRRNGVHLLSDAVEPDQQPADVAVMMLDVDLFKGINDTFGHDVGDQVLRRIGTVLAAHVRTTDLAARLGGDEFVVVLADAPAGLPEARAQQILDAIRDHAWGDIAPGLTVSVSLGLQCGQAGRLFELLSDADRNLYRAKRGGRGRVTGEPGRPAPDDDPEG